MPGGYLANNRGTRSVSDHTEVSLDFNKDGDLLDEAANGLGLLSVGLGVAGILGAPISGGITLGISVGALGFGLADGGYF